MMLMMMMAWHMQQSRSVANCRRFIDIIIDTTDVDWLCPRSTLTVQSNRSRPIFTSQDLAEWRDTEEKGHIKFTNRLAKFGSSSNLLSCWIKWFQAGKSSTTCSVLLLRVSALAFQSKDKGISPFSPTSTSAISRRTILRACNAVIGKLKPENWMIEVQRYRIIPVYNLWRWRD